MRHAVTILVLVLVGTAAPAVLRFEPATDVGGRAPAAADAPPVGAPAAPAFVLPVPEPAVVLVAFRPPERRYGPGHRGADLAVPAGGPVRSAGPGIVVFAGALAGRGVVSVLHAGGLRTTYEPVDAAVIAGQQLTAGSPLGVVDPGHAPCAPQTCLHWGARLPDGTYLDPMSLLRPWRVRLLPWSGPP